MEDRSLDDFLSDGDDESGETDERGVTGGERASEGEDPEDDVPDDRSGGDGTDDVDPATPTYRWTPGGTACTDCGTSVECGWFDEGRFVCIDCKEW